MGEQHHQFGVSGPGGRPLGEHGYRGFQVTYREDDRSFHHRLRHRIQGQLQARDHSGETHTAASQRPPQIPVFLR